MGNVIELPNITPESLEEERKPKAQQPKNNEAYDTKNYLNVRLKPEETEKVLTIRLLPMDLKTGNPFVKVHVHNVKVPKELAPNSVKPYKTYICLSKTKDIDHDKFGTKCPFCEINSSAYNDSTKENDPVKKKELQDISIANKSKEAVIVRCIERGNEAEGVKFWKFNLRNDKKDPYHTIINLYNQRKAEGEKAGRVENILDIYNGYDLTVTITAGEPVPPPTITDAKYPTPLSTDEEEMRKWIYDEKKWQDVFPCKTYEYLSLVSEMRIPWFDKNKGIWVEKKEHDDEKNEETEKADEEIKEAENKVKKEQPATVQTAAQQPVKEKSILDSVTINDSDLPF
jgi:hypothetical protein